MVEEETTQVNTNVPSMLSIHIVEQIEYYFGDFNMIKDKFLKQEVRKDNGWIPFKMLLRFNRLAALTKDVKVILNSFKENPSTLVEVDFERQCVRRHPDREIPEPDENWRKSVTLRTVYIKGFPQDTTTLDDILNFLQSFGKIDNVFRRTYYDKSIKLWKFKGSAYVTFPTREDAKSFLDIKTVKYAGNELIRKWQADYLEEKKTERIQQKLKAKEAKDQLLEEQKEEIKKEMKKLPTGALIHLQGLTKAITLLDIKNKVTQSFNWDVAFIDYTIGKPEACIRLREQDSAKEALTKLNNNTFELEKKIITASLVEGDKEIELLEKMEADKNEKVIGNLLKRKTAGKKKGKKKGNKQEKNGKTDETNIHVKNDKTDETNIHVKNDKTDETNIHVENDKTDETNIHVKNEKMDNQESISTNEIDSVKIKVEPGSSESNNEGSSLKRKTNGDDLGDNKKIKSENS